MVRSSADTPAPAEVVAEVKAAVKPVKLATAPAAAPMSLVAKLIPFADAEVSVTVDRVTACRPAVGVASVRAAPPAAAKPVRVTAPEPVRVLSVAELLYTPPDRLMAPAVLVAVTPVRAVTALMAAAILSPLSAMDEPAAMAPTSTPLMKIVPAALDVVAAARVIAVPAVKLPYDVPPAPRPTDALAPVVPATMMLRPSAAVRLTAPVVVLATAVTPVCEVLRLMAAAT